EQGCGESAQSQHGLTRRPDGARRARGPIECGKRPCGARAGARRAAADTPRAGVVKLSPRLYSAAVSGSRRLAAIVAGTGVLAFVASAGAAGPPAALAQALERTSAARSEHVSFSERV